MGPKDKKYLLGYHILSDGEIAQLQGHADRVANLAPEKAYPGNFWWAGRTKELIASHRLLQQQVDELTHNTDECVDCGRPLHGHGCRCRECGEK